MYVKIECGKCQSRTACGEFYDLENFTETATLNAKTEIEITTPNKLGRFLLGFCTKARAEVAVDIGHLPAESVGNTVGIHNLRLLGLPTVRIDMNELEYAPQAPQLETEVLDAMLG